MSCQEKGGKKTTTLPPPCYHCRPPRFACPMYGCPPPEPCPPRLSCPEPCGTLKCRQPPEKPPAPPTLCIARPCPEPVSGKPSCLPSPQRIKPPKTSVRFCIENTCEGATYCPCYKAEMPCCSKRY